MDEPATQDEGSPAPRPRRRWRRRLLVVGVVLLLLLVAAPLALSLPFVRTMVADGIGDALGREVTIGSAFAFWGHGIDLDDIRVSSPEGFDAPLATVKHVHVDLDLFALLGGGLDAEVLVVEPHVAFAKTADGRSNTDGLFEKEGEPGPDAPTQEAEPDEAADLSLRVEVVDGVVHARFAGADEPEELRDLDSVVQIDGGGSLTLKLTAVAVAAAAGGGDAKLLVDVALDEAGTGPLEVAIPAIDLSRLAGIAEGASGITGLRGRFELTAKGELKGGDRGAGDAQAQADGLALRTAGGTRFAVQKIQAKAHVEEESGNTAGDVWVRIDHVELRDESGETVRRFHEPLIELVLRGHHAPDEDLVRVESGKLTAGQAMTVDASEAWEIRTGDSPSAKGELVVQADLGRLTSLRNFVPALASLRAGRIGARVVAEAEDGLNVRTGIRVVGLDIAPGDLSPRGHVERDLVVQLQVRRAAGEGDVPVHVLVSGLTSSFATLGRAPGKKPLVLTIADAGIGAHGAATLDLQLAALGTAFGGVLGLGPADTLGGSVRLTPDAQLEPDAGTMTVGVAGRAVTLPRAWLEGVPPSSLDGSLKATASGTVLDLSLERLRSLGLNARGTARYDRAKEQGGLERADLHVTGDLSRARPLLASLLGLDGGARLEGRLDAEAKLAEREGTRSLDGRWTVTGLAWHDARGRLVLQDPKLEITHELSMSTDAGDETRYAFRKLQLVSQALQVRVEGAATSSSGTTALDAALHLDGDAARLAGILRSAFGEEYQDLRGSGRIKGTVTCKGSTANGAETLLTNGSLRPGTWSAGGLTMADATLALKRASTADPLRLEFAGGLNGGRMDVGFGVRPGPTMNPFTLELTLARVDTSPLLVDHGAGEYLTFFLPTLIPSDSTAPVLNGLLDAQIAVRAADLGERLESTLKGDGFVKMDQGSIGNSTLFRVVSGGKGLGDVGSLLVKAVPEVGDALAGMQRSLTFTKMESQFTVANRVVNVTKGLLDGERTRIDFKGTVGFNEVVNLDVALTLLGTAGRRLEKVLSTPTIPLKVTGPMDAPRIAPGIDASKLARGALDGLLPGDGKNPLDGLKDLIPR